MIRLKRVLRVTVLLLCLAPLAEAENIPGTNGVPDLTKGGILKRINLRWAGPAGIFCGSWRPRGQKMTDVRQLLVLALEKGSPADGILKVGDVILGADGTAAETVSLFKGAEFCMIPLADAITEAEARDPAILKLLIWRPNKKGQKEPDPVPEKYFNNPKAVSKLLKPQTEGKTLIVTITLESLGRYSDTAPYNCEKSKRILRKGIKALYESNDPGKFFMGVLSLLAADDPSNPDNDKYQARAKEWVHKLIDEKTVECGAWESGVRLIILSEYYMKTEDKAVFPYLVKQAEHHARGVSWFGTTGHRFADKKPDGSFGGRIGGYGPINCSGTQGFLGLSLARHAGVNRPVVDDAIKRQRIFFGHWAFHSGMGYGEMPYAIAGGSGDRNGVHALTALAMGLQDNKEDKAKYFTRMTALSSFQSRQYAHGGPFFGQVWQPVAAGQGGVKTANMQFKEIRWHLDLKRHWDHSRIYDPTNNKYKGFSDSVTALMFYALPLKQLYVTGRGRKDTLTLSDAEFAELVKCKTFDAGKATDQELIAELSRHQGMTRPAAAGELADRIKKDLGSAESAARVDQLLALAADRTAPTSGRAGACTTLMFLKKKNADNSEQNLKIVKTMIDLLKDPDPYMRFGAVRVMQAFHPNFSQVAIRPYANEIMDAIIATERPTFPLDEEDPCQWAHGEMGAFLFGKVLAKDLDGVDREKLIPALRSILRTPNGSARYRASRVLARLNLGEARHVAAELVDNIKIAPPANAMGGSAAPNSQAILATHRFEEALPLSLIYGGSIAIKNKIPEKYGRAAFTMQSSRELVRALGRLMIVDASLDSYKILEQMQKTPGPEEMHKLKRIDGIRVAQSTLTLPANSTALELDANNDGLREPNATTYTWRKVYGAGKVSFTPNASGQSKTTTVSFTDRKPGIYRFEVVMTDDLGYNELRKTVDVTLYDENGKLPSNNAPKAKDLSLKAAPGLPLPVTLSGSDPDGDDLGYRITKAPSNGRLSGSGAKLVYTADFGFNGTDSFTFEAIDGQGKTAIGKVTFQVSDKDVGVIVYEGFDYRAGAIQNRGGVPSFGFDGPWTNTKGTKDFYHVAAGSSSYADLPATGGKLIKGQRWWPLSRPLDPAALSGQKLLDNGRELWFSMFVDQPHGLLFRFAGPDISFGLEVKSRRSEIYATFQGKIAGKANNPWSRSTSLRFPQGPNMIIGHCVWGKIDEEPDTMEIFRVFDAPAFGPLFLENPVCVLSEVIPQEKINQVWMKGFETGSVDEIRIGPTLHSVMVGTKPMGEKSKQ